jgi:hypothetical protein
MATPAAGRGGASSAERPNVAEITPEVASALRQAALRNERTVIQYGGKSVAIIPIRDLLLLERLVEQEEARRDVEEAERRLSDPAEVPIPYDQARRELGLDRLSR